MSARTQNVGDGVRPIAVGTGLLALDIVYAMGKEEPVGRWAGGTCGNVLTILSFLGWSTYPVARLADNEPARLLCRDMASWGVHLNYVTRERRGRTPVIVQHIRRDKAGQVCHSFSFRCPACGNKLPNYRPVPAYNIRRILTSMPTPAVFFFDRISRGAIDIATTFRKNGALVVFEPSKRGAQVFFEEALSVSHIVKVSHESWAHRGELKPRKTNWLVIETLGPEGLRFLSRLPSYHSSKWQHIPSFPVRNYKDAAGAGDWCTAGFIACIGGQGAQGMKRIGEEQLRHALRQGQLLASWNCGFEGARGGMYSWHRKQLRELVLGIFPKPSFSRLKSRPLTASSLFEAQRNRTGKVRA